MRDAQVLALEAADGIIDAPSIPILEGSSLCPRVLATGQRAADKGIWDPRPSFLA
jgi:hypothetical protein